MNEEDKKRPAEDDAGKSSSSTMDGLVAVAAAAAAVYDKDDGAGGKKQKKCKRNNVQQTVPAARARRLEQNRLAAIESRRRKKVMIAELQRSVTFYSKANKNLKKANEELEQQMMIAKQKLSGKYGETAVATENLKTPEEECSTVKSSPEPMIEQNLAGATAFKTVASFQPQVNTSPEMAPFTVMQAVSENIYMGYPPVAARSAVGVFSPFDMGFNHSRMPEVDAGADCAGNEFIKTLEQFAMEKTAVANAATLAANTALHIASWHKMINASGQRASISDEKKRPGPENEEK